MDVGEKRERERENYCLSNFSAEAVKFIQEVVEDIGLPYELIEVHDVLYLTSIPLS